MGVVWLGPLRSAGRLEYHFPLRANLHRREVNEMAKICQVSGKRGNTTAKHIRNQHSQGWKYKAPHKNRIQHPNLQTVRVKTEHGVVKMKVSTAVIKSAEFNAVVCGLKPVPKAWLKKPSYNISATFYCCVIKK